MAVAGAADKRNYTANMACSAAGDILPPQLIFKKKVCSGRIVTELFWMLLTTFGQHILLVHDPVSTLS